MDFNAKSVNFFTKRFKRHQIVLEILRDSENNEPNLLIVDTLNGDVVEKTTIPENIKKVVYDSKTQKILVMSEDVESQISDFNCYLMDSNLKILEKVASDKYSVVLGCEIILGRVVCLSENGVAIGIDEENDKPDRC